MRPSGASMLDKQHLQISAALVAAKFKSKRKVPQSLILDARAYFCSEDFLTIYFLQDLIYGKKKCDSLL